MESARAACTVCSPPPCGEGLGVGVAVGGYSLRHNYDPPPQPSPTRGREQTAVASQLSCIQLNGTRFRIITRASRGYPYRSTTAAPA